jgi:pimeloyl-ACP methyl ester carboxylesterase
MPFRLAVFGVNRADQVMAQHDYGHWYIGGHSLGGAMAASYASTHNSQLSGVFMLAAYPTKPLAENMKALMIYGSEDGVLNMSKLEAAIRNLPDSGEVYVIEGGNHAQFGNYGAQAGDGHAVISSEEQQQRTAEWILLNIQTASGSSEYPGT